jgi:hypothetical protein
MTQKIFFMSFVKDLGVLGGFLKVISKKAKWTLPKN